MMKNIQTVTISQILALLVVIFLAGCNEKEEIPATLNNLRVLTVFANGEKMSEGTATVESRGLSIEVVFSHSLNISAFENALSISGSPEYSMHYDETNSFVTLTFDNLAFDTDYTIHLPSGTYGAKKEVLKEDYQFTFTTKAFVAPVITLSADPTALLEGGEATVTATLNKATIHDVNVALQFSGTAENEVDYLLSADSLTIPQGSTSATFTVKALNDEDMEGEETLEITIREVQGAVESSPQVIQMTIKDGASALILKGIMALRWATETDGSSGKAVHLVAAEDIPDLSVYSLGVANNGGGSDSIEFNLPAIAVAAGEDILVARDPLALETYFGCFAEFEHVIQTDEMSQNGDDAIELYNGTAVIETYGDANVDGTGQHWEYSGSWAYKVGGEWITAPVDCADGSTTTLGSACIYPLCDQPLILKGVLALLWDGSGTNGGKAVHLMANRDIDDLSEYSIGVANNGGGTDGIEYTFPEMAVSAGDHILLAREPNTLSSYFGSCFDGFDHVLQTDAMNQNGDDAIELFDGTQVIETCGDADVDGTGQPWEYTGSWAYKVASEWTYGGVDCAAGSTTTQEAFCSYLFCK